jgi:hypothetical protein
MSTSLEFIANAKVTPTSQGEEGVYMASFGFTAGEKLLDLGSGKTNFSVLSSDVVQLDLAYSDPDRRPANTGRLVQGIYQELPLKDEVFDRVVCHWGGLHLSEEGMRTTLSESLRVVKPKGWVQILPVDMCGEAAVARESEDGFTVQSRPYRVKERCSPVMSLPVQLRTHGIDLLTRGRYHSVSIQKTEKLADAAAQQAFAERMAPALIWVRNR